MPLTALDYAIAGITTLAPVIIYLRLSRDHSRTSSLPLPPGPPRWPLVGSLFSLPDSSVPNWIWFTQWANQTASDITYFRVLGTDTVVLNTREAAVELLERRSSVYSDRPHMVMATDLVGWSEFLVMADYSERTKVMRRYMHQIISVKTMPDWQGPQEQAAYRFLQKLLHSPENLISHIKHTAAATVLRLTYGYTPKDEDDDYIRVAELAMDNFSVASTPGMFMVDMFPILKYIPWAPFKRTAVEWRKQMLDLINTPMAYVHDQLKQGVAEPSFVSKWLDEPDRGDNKDLIPVTAAGVYAGGADTASRITITTD